MIRSWLPILVSCALSFAAMRSPALAAPIDACQLMSQTEAAQYIGGPAGAAEHPFHELGSCAYGAKNPAPATGSIIFSTMTDADVARLRERAASIEPTCHPNPPPGRESSCALFAKLSNAQNTRDVLAAYATTPNVMKLSGTADEAVWVTSPGGPGAGHQLFARSGDRVIQVLVELKGQEDLEASKRAAQLLIGRFQSAKIDP